MKPEPGSIGEKRRAALTLHALHSEDRDWLLAQLSAPQRDELLALLAELAELGIPSDGDLVSNALATTRPMGQPQPVAKAVLQADSKMLAKLLSPEPDAVALHCLSLLDESQRAEVTGLLTGDKRARLRGMQLLPAPALTAAIAKQMTAALAAQA
jgi:hypothetical protein